MQYKRKLRVAELIKINLSTIIQRDLSGKLPGLATIMHVDLSDDLNHAKINVSLFGSDDVKRRSLLCLKREIKYLRKQLGQAISLRKTPVLTIVEDTSLDNAFRINELLAQIHNDEKKSGTTDTT